MKFLTCLGLFSLIHFTASAANETAAKAPASSVLSNPLFIILLTIIIFLAILIKAFAGVVDAAADRKIKKEKAANKGTGAGLKTLLMLVAIGFTTSLLAQGAAPASPAPVKAVAPDGYWGLNSSTLYLMLIVIAFEILIIGLLYVNSMQLLGAKERRRRFAEQKAKAAVKEPTFIEKINASVAIEQEEEIMLDHNYDGIRELDNNLPPWWKYGFYATIVFAVVYLIHFHVSNTGKLPLEEYEDQMAQAKHDIEEYRKKASGLVDENNVTKLTDEASISSGKAIFMANCKVCHGQAGEGVVGPNLTDDYWLHQGGIKDVFKSIKYGWPEKGMKSWEQDLNPKQINEVASFILSLHGTNPPNAKEKQGELYKEEGGAADTTKQTVADTTKQTADSAKVEVKVK